MLKILLELLGPLLSNLLSNRGSRPSPSSEAAPPAPPKPDPGPPKHRTINQAGLSLIKEFESLRLESYKDIAGIWTIGYGSTGPDIGPDMIWTEKQCEDRLKSDLSLFERGIDSVITAPVTDNQFSAVVVLAYNVGINGARKSTLVKLLNLKDYSAAADEFLKWNKSGGKEVPGLTRRRIAEKELFLRA